MEKMIEKAKEELQLLETLHPHKFNYMKLELQSFISLLHSHQLLDSLPCTSSATTQASTSMKRKRVSWRKREMEDQTKKRKQRDRVDVVLDKAHACLRKIQDFKNSTT
ncbi:hypothetical protein RND81_09G208200 [Saponaria officinalis]|uniref:Uncharacterized protein n=1 Tax=Saponaria officinalis TaxID=3572 RepID=A0AAW1INI6_SAPOF